MKIAVYLLDLMITILFAGFVFGTYHLFGYGYNEMVNRALALLFVIPGRLLFEFYFG